MKQINELTDEISEITNEMLANKKRRKGEVGFITPGGIKKMKARKEYLELCISYLKTNPTPEYIAKEKQRLLNRNDLIMKGLPSNASKKEKRDYEKLMDLPKVRLQLRTLNFIS